MRSAAHVSHSHRQQGKPSKAVRYQLAQSDAQASCCPATSRLQALHLAVHAGPPQPTCIAADSAEPDRASIIIPNRGMSMQVFLHPSSALHKSAPEWIVYSQLVQTDKRIYMSGMKLGHSSISLRPGAAGVMLGIYVTAAAQALLA